MGKYYHAVVEFLKNEEGPTSTEHAILLSLIIVFCVSSISGIGNKATKSFNTVGNTLGQASGS
jgi:pilus assembly protein Flp/PilA